MTGLTMRRALRGIIPKLDINTSKIRQGNIRSNMVLGNQ